MTKMILEISCMFLSSGTLRFILETDMNKSLMPSQQL